MMPDGWSGEAFNQVPHSQNEIHGDRIARLYGFEGGLVPGVTVSAYLLHPAVESWGEAFLERGRAHVRVVSPLYDRERFAVFVEDAAETGYRARLERPDGTVSARAEVELPTPPDVIPARRGDPVAEAGFRGPAATREHFERLGAEGCRALRYRWEPAEDMGRYLRDPAGMPALLRGEDACANASWILGISNWVLAANAYMNPWVHLETHSQHFRAIGRGTELVAEMSVTGLFEKKGHEFVDVTVALFDLADDAALASVDLRAIYRLRGL